MRLVPRSTIVEWFVVLGICGLVSMLAGINMRAVDGIAVVLTHVGYMWDEITWRKPQAAVNPANKE